MAQVEMTTRASREFLMTRENFVAIQKIAYKITGINLSDHKENMIYGRLAKRVRFLGLSNFSDYCQLISQEDSSEIPEFVNSITTNLTAFFREKHHFDYLQKTVFPEIISNFSSNRRLRIWSAGCSTGEEPYSIGMVLQNFTAFKNWNAKILATDLDSNVVAKARAGHYTAERLATIPNEYQKYVRYQSSSKSNGSVESGDGCIKDSIQGLITFNPLNLLHPWPMKGPFDIIFCRNVVIYFDADTQRKLFNRYADILKPNGYLFIGHSENLYKISDRFRGLGNTIYQRVS